MASINMQGRVNVGLVYVHTADKIQNHYLQDSSKTYSMYPYQNSEVIVIIYYHLLEVPL